MATAEIKPRGRKGFSKIPSTIRIPNLIEVQKRSYERFLQMYTAPDDREDVGLQAVFKSIFPIEDFRETCSLEFMEYSIGHWACKCEILQGIEKLRVVCRNCGQPFIARMPKESEFGCPSCGESNPNKLEICEECGEPVGLKFKYSMEECQARGMSFNVPLKVTIHLIVYDKDPETGARSIRDIKEQEVYFGEIPMLTGDGTFIINGTERVIVSQLHRSPGVFFQATPDRSTHTAKIIPYRGAWVEFEYDQKQILNVRIDRKRKFHGTVFLRALGLSSDEEILREFYTPTEVLLQEENILWGVGPGLLQKRALEEIKNDQGKTILRKGVKIRKANLKRLEDAAIAYVPVAEEEFSGAVALEPIVHPETGELICEVNQEITAEQLAEIREAGIERLIVFFPENDPVGPVLHTTLKKDGVKTPEEALLEIYRKLRPGDPPTFDAANKLFNAMFFDPQRYDFSRVGRLKFNTRLGTSRPLDEKILHPDDFYAVVRYFLGLSQGEGQLDDIDHLGSRRVRSVGELLENQFRIGLIRMERAIKEKMSVYQEMTTAMPHDLINAKPVVAAVQEFFGSSQLSQFMDQTNPLSEVTHKRRLSALGPGGLSRERAGFEVRDVHPTHYGRICPIETPEGPNIGLISSLACYARINDYGFIESPYRKVVDGRVVDHVRLTYAGGTGREVGEVMPLDEFEDLVASMEKAGKRKPAAEPYAFYLTAWEEDRMTIAQANAPLDENGRFVNERVTARRAGSFLFAPREEIDFIDVSPQQLVSVAAALVPFLENDDANRALMGSNMQRQAVPLLQPESPVVGTGMEETTARDSGAVVICRRSGIVDKIDATRIIVRVTGEEGGEDFGADVYSLVKFRRSNQNTCINQRPIVSQGDRVRAGQVLADGPCTENGELALGRNVLVAFMPWRGYNFEDAILVSERLVREDAYTSIHIEEFEVEARDTKLGPEEITRDIPNVSEEFLKDLDESGIIRIGAHVKPGDILVGKVTPKGETQLTPEEKLLRAIFGEKSGDVRDASLTSPPGIEGIVVDVRVFARKGQEKDSRHRAIEREQIQRWEKNLNDEIRIINEENRRLIADLLEGEPLRSALVSLDGSREVLPEGTVLSREIIRELQTEDLMRLDVAPKRKATIEAIRKIEERTQKKVQLLEKFHRERIEALAKGDELAPGVIKLVKVFIAMKRKLSVGDKMAGRHGNKGVIARILPIEDLPYLPDGTPVDVVLNPLGVPSRMNVGQILETHLGWAGMALGMKFATPVFDGAREKDIKHYLEQAGLPLDGKTYLHDGMTGERFEQKVTVGYIYLLKLSHLVDDKIHARSIGPYSLITQQPLGGKAQFGGQRFGEMEVWALEAYGAAHVLQELLTCKSDDVYGRTKIYEAIVKGQGWVEPGLPESFNVLIKELQALCLDIELLAEQGEDDA
ncbi:MAG: DNA-directed RNA polymerase subunit beta [Acidobacteriota bacterium]|nr:DNA-directed RNA polymerase subunit beta [Acidobacteriota bacterium]MDQ7086624.1 DNA-directed RNA polymerase subunit beta [Acidobacteriota bacterium]